MTGTGLMATTGQYLVRQHRPLHLLPPLHLLRHPSYSDPYSNSDADTHAHTNSHSNSDPYSDANNNSDADAYSVTLASSKQCGPSDGRHGATYCYRNRTG